MTCNEALAKSSETTLLEQGTAGVAGMRREHHLASRRAHFKLVACLLISFQAIRECYVRYICVSVFSHVSTAVNYDEATMAQVERIQKEVVKMMFNCDSVLWY